MAEETVRDHNITRKPAFHGYFEITVEEKDQPAQILIFGKARETPDPLPEGKGMLIKPLLRIFRGVFHAPHGKNRVFLQSPLRR